MDFRPLLKIFSGRETAEQTVQGKLYHKQNGLSTVFFSFCLKSADFKPNYLS